MIRNILLSLMGIFGSALLISTILLLGKSSFTDTLTSSILLLAIAYIFYNELSKEK